jgi:2-methylcitrate dehydratase PrpD
MNETTDATQCLAEFVHTLQWSDLPRAVIEHSKLCILDALGCCLFGSTLPSTKILVETILSDGSKEQAGILGTTHRVSIANAALVNGTSGHSFEFDDLHTAALLHATTLSVPVALAFADTRDMSGEDFILACVAGFECGLRVGIAGTHGLFNRGFHPQGTSGVFCSAATAARALRLDAKRTQHALGIAASLASGLMAAQEGAMTKRLHSGLAARAGVFAAQLASRDYTGILNAIETPYGGFLAAYSDAPRPDLLLAGLGTDWETLAIGFKMYPTVSCLHSPMKLLHEIMGKNALQAEQIETLHVKCGTFTYRHTVWPYQASGLTEAQMNMFYGLSAMALHGDVSPAQFDLQKLADPKLLQFVAKISVDIDPQIDALGPAHRDAVEVDLTTVDGRRLHGRAEWRPGSPEAPLSAEELRKKFGKLTSGLWPPDKINRVIEIVDRLPVAPTTKPLIELLWA